MEGKIKLSCKFPKCKNVRRLGNGEQKRFHVFPANPDMCKVWREICEIPEGINCKNLYVCRDHFTNNDYNNPNEPLRLSPTSIPKNLCLISESEHVNLLSEQPGCSGIEISVSEPKIIESKICFDPMSFTVEKPVDKFKFLNFKSTGGILAQAGCSKETLTPSESIMYKIHRNTTSKVSKLKSLLKNERDQFAKLKTLYKRGRFEAIEEDLNSISRNFINSQLRNSGKSSNARRWTVQDKAFALSIYKRSPRLYKYLRAYFQLPSQRLLKSALASIPFQCGFLEPVFDYIKNELAGMDELDRSYTLILDEISLNRGFHYDSSREDLGPFGQSSRPANHALVFLIRGIKKNFKLPVAYFFTRDTISTSSLKNIIVSLVEKLQLVGINIVATVCDQGPTNRAAIALLTQTNTDDKPCPYHFCVNGKKIYTIFDVPHLLKNTRNALISCNIEFESGRLAKMEHIRSAFEADAGRTFKVLPELKETHFNFKDSFSKKKVKTAAQLLSRSVSVAIETFHISGQLPAEAIHTAEFVYMMNDLFDSLNSAGPYAFGGKKFKCALSNDSAHLDFWSSLLPKLAQWKLYDLDSKKLRTNYKFVEGWQITIRAIQSLWRDLSQKGLQYLSLKNLNQDPLENLFGQIRQHGVNTNPTCHQFVAALKTVLVNNFTTPLSNGNCEADNCQSLVNFQAILEEVSEQPDLNLNVSTEVTPDEVEELDELD